MSGAITAFAAAAGAASFLETLLISTPRSIGSLVPNCAIEERHLDRLVITQHPVEVGANISDHYFKMPTEVTLRWAWTDAGNGDGFVEEVYNYLLVLQTSGTPFTLYTGKQAYSSMMLTSLMVTTDKDTEKALMCQAVCQQIIIVSTQAVQAPPLSDQAEPQQTGGTVNTGPQTPATVPPSSSNGSILANIFGGTH
jgi:hypothetical protein